MALARPTIRLSSVLTAALVAAALAAPARAAETGINSAGTSPTAAAQMATDLNATWIRSFARWDLIEPNGPDAWSADQIAALDQLTAAARERGKKVVVVISGTPRWASTTADPFSPPVDAAEFGRFLRSLSARYRGLVTAWEIWNEPDETEFWKGSPPSPDAYLPVLRAAHAAIRAGDPGALVLAAPSTGNNYPFLEGLYARGARGSFDGVAVHTDTACLIKGPDDYYREGDGRVGRFSFLGLREMHATMAARGDGDLPIIITELGWSATGTVCGRGASAGQKAAGVSEAKQATYLKHAYRCLASYPYVRAALWFTARDGGPQDSELTRYGLERFDGSRRPAYGALAEIGRSGAAPGACGDFDPPALRVRKPAEGALFDRSLEIEVAAKDGASRLGRISLYANGRKVRSFTENLKNDRAVGLEWMGARELPYGPVTLKVEALDSFGNVTTREVPVQRVDPRTLPPQQTTLAIRLSGKGVKRKVRGSLKAASSFAPTGKLRVEWQYRRGSAWVTLHKTSKNANRAFSASQRLRKKGRWRVKVSYPATKPFRPATALKAFRAR